MTNTVRFIHTADLHLDSPLKSLASRNSSLRDVLNDASRTVLRRLVDTAITEQVDALLIAGDLFDGELRDVRTAKVLERELRRLESHNIPVFIIWGNHDAEARLTEALDLPKNVHTFDGRGGSIGFADDQAFVHGVSFAKRKAPNSLLGKFNPPVAGCINIGMLHTSLTGTESHNNYAPCTVPDLIDMGYDYWALGHIHKRQVHHTQPAVVMPGNPLGRHINESGERTITLVNLAQGEDAVLQKISIAPVSFERLTINLGQSSDRRSAIEFIGSSVENASNESEADHLVLRLELTGESHLAASFKRNVDVILTELRLEYEHNEDIWIDSIDTKKLCEISEISSNAPTDNVGYLTPLMRLIDDDLLSSLNLKDSIEEDLNALARALPGELNGIFEEVETDGHEINTQDIMEKGSHWILTQLSSDNSDSNKDETA